MIRDVVVCDQCRRPISIPALGKCLAVTQGAPLSGAVHLCSLGCLAAFAAAACRVLEQLHDVAGA